MKWYSAWLVYTNPHSAHTLVVLIDANMIQPFRVTLHNKPMNMKQQGLVTGVSVDLPVNPTHNKALRGSACHLWYTSPLSSSPSQLVC